MHRKILECTVDAARNRRLNNFRCASCLPPLRGSSRLLTRVRIRRVTRLVSLLIPLALVFYLLRVLLGTVSGYARGGSGCTSVPLRALMHAHRGSDLRGSAAFMSLFAVVDAASYPVRMLDTGAPARHCAGAGGRSRCARSDEMRFRALVYAAVVFFAAPVLLWVSARPARGDSARGQKLS